MANLTIGIGEWAVSKNAEDVLKTYALGSCVAVMIYDSRTRIAGLIHVALPESSIDTERAKVQPGYFADTGLPRMIQEMKDLGATRGTVWVKLAGGAAVMDARNFFDIGKRNILAVKRILWKSSLGPLAEDTGGTNSRTVSFSVDDGAVKLSSGPKSWNI
ncbi:MAG: chemotaxis protein CheD [Treponema sp. GWB1_62_6]|nr:MAG: chemotaxis protein CheD [Treponema sp. GWB1_62_6]OHE66518.1 MAG: chemotaxis protein CheD [Treponema sp. GWA1_62_8]OHE70028.1 MAG: chemotaxis protein CheD [Treponema sp. GWC1_61_84]OHE74540.1 MAG: chemotaxis protein CheD [Treponema sp. RIFOXYC1_FULL_61_9]HCM25416.1 chemotaxis protein CheD [Treponema sp.]